MDCKESKIICPIGATGGECTFDILCCGDLEDQYVSYTLSEGDQKVICVQDSDLEPVVVTSISGSRTNSSLPCSSFCGELNPNPAPSPAAPGPGPTPTPTPTPSGSCQCYQLLFEDAGTATINYTACGGGSSSIIIDAGTLYYVCSTTTPTTSDPAVTITAFGSPGGCSQNIDCDPNPPAPSPSPSPAPSPTPSPTPAPTTPTPTPTPSNACTIWELTCPSGSGTCSYSYIDCFGNTLTGDVPSDQEVEVCVLDGNTPLVQNGGTPVNTGEVCSGAPSPTPAPSAPTPAPSSTPTPTPTPTSIRCTFWDLTCGSPGSCTFRYIDCNAVTQTITLDPDGDFEACVLEFTTPELVSGSGGKKDSGDDCTVAPSPTPTAPAPVPTPTPAVPDCTVYELACGSSESCNYSYTNCNGTPISGLIDPDREIEVCVKKNTSPTIQNGGKINTNDPCGITPTPTSPYTYKEYSKCNDSTTKQVFYAGIGYVFPIVVTYGDSCYENQQDTGQTTGVLVNLLPTYNTCAECLAVNPNPNVCLEVNNTVEVLNPGTGNVYEFNGVTGNPYGTTTGTYILLDVPQSHPIAILNYGKTSLISYTGINSTTGTAPDGRTYNFYWGDVTITVTGDYQTVSYACLIHGYMGGQDNLGFNPTVCSIPPAPTPTPGTAPTPTPSSVVPPIPSPVETEYTLTYSQNSKGWPSFYSYIPDFMLGMNQYFYSFHQGNIFQHNLNTKRNNFYGEQYSSQITTVFNQNPLENKIFKTINLESDQAWQANLETDIQENGFIENTWFTEKEGSYFAFLRQTGEVPALTGQYALRSANGIGRSTNYIIAGDVTTILFSTNPVVDIGSIVSIGDYLYFSLPSYTAINLGGQITNITVNIPAGINQISIDTSITGTLPMTIADPFILYIKNSVAETHGLLGHYCIFTLINDSSTSTELFAVESEVMKSYP